MSLAKQAPVLLAAFALVAAMLYGTRNSSLRPAEAETPTAQPVPAATPSAQYGSTGYGAAAPSARSVTLEMENGHYWAAAKVNNTQVRFLVDTGASVVALTKDDARRIGVTVRSHGEVVRLSTANGEITVPVVTLKRIRIGGVEVTNVPAVVVEEGLSTSLLGMSFLSELKSWQTTPAGLVLKQ